MSISTRADDLRPARETERLKIPIPGDAGPADFVTDVGAVADRIDEVAVASGLGVGMFNTWSTWSAEAGNLTRVVLARVPIFITNPSGARIAGTVTTTQFAHAGNSQIQGSLEIDDGRGQKTYALFFFSQAGVHLPFTWSCITDPVEPGEHELIVGLWLATAHVGWDQSDGGSGIFWELP